MKVPLLHLKAQYESIRDDVRKALDDVCESQRFIMGPKVEEFEARVAEYCGTNHAVGVSSGTDAILVSLMALDVGPGDAVITTPYSFFATAGCIARVGATPVFADIDPVTYNVTAVTVEAALKKLESNPASPSPKVIMPVHLYGQTADMDPIMEIARSRGLAVVEDAAQAIGAQYPSNKGVVRAGSIGDAGCFSFFPSKNLGGFGDGGMVVTNDDALADKLKIMRNHGARPKYYHALVGGNFRLDAIQAAILDVKLKRLPEWHEGRRKNAQRYDELFKNTVVETPRPVYAQSEAPDYHIYNQYIVRVPDRDNVKKILQEAGVGCEIYYPLPLHIQECFGYLGYSEGAMPESERAAETTLALPVYPELPGEMQEFAAEALLKAVKMGE